MQLPNVQLEDIITVGDPNISSIKAVVSNIYTLDPKKIEVVYLGEDKKEYNEDVIWENDKWAFLPGASAGYAWMYDRLEPYINKLHSYLSRPDLFG